MAGFNWTASREPETGASWATDWELGAGVDRAANREPEAGVGRTTDREPGAGVSRVANWEPGRSCGSFVVLGSRRGQHWDLRLRLGSFCAGDSKAKARSKRKETRELEEMELDRRKP